MSFGHGSAITVVSRGTREYSSGLAAPIRHTVDTASAHCSTVAGSVEGKSARGPRFSRPKYEVPPIAPHPATPDVVTRRPGWAPVLVGSATRAALKPRCGDRSRPAAISRRRRRSIATKHRATWSPCCEPSAIRQPGGTGVRYAARDASRRASPQVIAWRIGLQLRERLRAGPRPCSAMAQRLSTARGRCGSVRLREPRHRDASVRIGIRIWPVRTTTPRSPP